MSEPTARELAEMTAFELTAYRRELERVLGLPDLPPIYLQRASAAGRRTPMREHDVSRLTAAELERAKRELQASLGLVRPDSPARVPIVAQMTAIDAQLGEQAERES